MILSERNSRARRMFAGIAPQYERMGAVMSLGQDARWRRFLVSKVNAIPGSWVLDVAAGTGLVSRDLAARKLVNVAALDQSEPMLHTGATATRAAGLHDRIAPVLAQAERLPFRDAAFDSVTFTYLLRYVDDPGATLQELARVLRPGGTMVSLEFHVPSQAIAHIGWWAYTRLALPAIGALASPAWAHTGRFLGPDVSAFVRSNPLPAQIRWWQDAGITRVRSRTFLLGTSIVIWGVKGR